MFQHDYNLEHTNMSIIKWLKIFGNDVALHLEVTMYTNGQCHNGGSDVSQCSPMYLKGGGGGGHEDDVSYA